MPRKKTENPRKYHIDTRLTLEEYEKIKFKAKSTGVSASEYLRSIGIGYPLTSKVDQLAIDQLLRAKADLGRLGGLFKLWLTSNEDYKEAAQIGSRNYENIDKLVSDIEKKEEELINIAKELLLRLKL